MTKGTPNTLGWVRRGRNEREAIRAGTEVEEAEEEGRCRAGLSSRLPRNSKRLCRYSNANYLQQVFRLRHDQRHQFFHYRHDDGQKARNEQGPSPILQRPRYGS